MPISPLAPLEREGDQRCSALAAQAGIDVSVASRQLAVLSGPATSSAVPTPTTGAPACCASRAGAEALAATRALRSDWALTDLDTAGARPAAVPAPR